MVASAYSPQEPPRCLMHASPEGHDPGMVLRWPQAWPGLSACVAHDDATTRTATSAIVEPASDA